MKKTAIVGAGLVGRVVALNLIKQGHQITLFDEDDSRGNQAAAMTAAGMLAPYSELETAESIIFELGNRSIELWGDLLKQINAEDALQFDGSLILAHPQDMADLTQFIDNIKYKINVDDIQTLDSNAIQQLEPELSHHKQGFYIKHEGQINSQQFMQASTAYLLAHSQLNWLENHKVSKILPRGVVICENNDEKRSFDCVFDTRGLGAKKDIDGLRGVRGEVFWLDAPDVNITRPIRLQHPRYKIYIVPRKNGRYVVGATEIESEDKSPMSVRSSLELLSAVYTIHPSFGEARIVKMLTNCRPALADNLPRITKDNKLITINGLYRHGYLLAPAIVERALQDD